MRRLCGCGRTYRYRSGLFNHIKLKHEGVAPKGTIYLKRGRPETKPQIRQRRVCSCGKTFKYRQGLHKHIKDKHGGVQPNAFELRERRKMTELSREKLMKDVLKKENDISLFEEHLKKC